MGVQGPRSSSGAQEGPGLGGRCPDRLQVRRGPQSLMEEAGDGQRPPFLGFWTETSNLPGPIQWGKVKPAGPSGGV